jgi:DNA-binding GntR family transcriptional regulator
MAGKPGKFRDIMDDIRSKIESGVLKPGDLLYESKLRVEYDSAKNTVTEALHNLESAGFIDHPYVAAMQGRPRGWRIRDLDRETAPCPHCGAGISLRDSIVMQASSQIEN